jgi:anti-anti-sigma regulatory factor
VQISSRRHDKVTIFDLSGDIDCANSRQLRESVLREIQENRRPTSW